MIIHASNNPNQKQRNRHLPKVRRRNVKPLRQNLVLHCRFLLVLRELHHVAAGTERDADDDQDRVDGGHEQGEEDEDVVPAPGAEDAQAHPQAQGHGNDAYA